MAFDPAQRFLDMVPGGQGIFYAVQADGVLLWYRNLGWQTGSPQWANNGTGRQIGNQWHQFVTVLANSDGQIFALQADGTLRWYQYILSNAQTGAGFWHAKSGTVIGHGFNTYGRVFGGWNNVLYCLDDSGVLFWYCYLGPPGTTNWANGGSGRRIGSGWKGYPWLVADPNGVVYGVWQGSELRWYRYVVQSYSTGAGFWRNGGQAITVGQAWGSDGQKLVRANTSGTLYGISLDTAATLTLGDDDSLTWYRLLNSETIDTSGVTWANSGNGVTIGRGFTVQAEAALQGYPGVLSVVQGGTVAIQVSTTFPSYSWSVQRVAPVSGGPVIMVQPTSHSGRLQLLPSAYRSAGCGWATDFSVSVPTTWPSGVYTALLQSSFGTSHPVMFVVRPATPVNRIAVVIPTNTYNAYNTWGGHDQYTVGQDGAPRTVTMRRPSVTTALTGGAVINCSLLSDLFLLQWMTSQGIAYDVYTDLDLDAPGTTPWTASYKAVVLMSHPEYFTGAMRQNLVNFASAGGRIVYTGGNGVYEEIQYTTDRSAIVFRDANGDRRLFEDINEPSSAILGVDYFAASYMDFAPYEVLTNHAFLNGTGLGVGSTFGATAYNGAASGWEVDESPGGIPGSVVIATGQNPAGGADMTYTAGPAGGWVFAAGSLSFNGAIGNDSAIQQILRNVFTAAVV